MGKSKLTTIRASAAATSSYVVSNEVEVDNAKYVHLRITVSGTASGDIVWVIPEGSMEESGTPTGARTWLPLKVGDGSVTSASPGTVPAGAAYSALGFATPSNYNYFIKTTAATGSSQTIVHHEILMLGGIKAFRVQVLSNPGTPNCKVDVVTFS